MERAEKVTKKQKILELYEDGLPVEMIAELVESNPTYVANVLAEAGYQAPYFDLYTSTTIGVASRYARAFAGVLKFRDVEAAKESVRKIDALYHSFQRARDRRGQHQAQLIALIGKNRAAGIGKRRESEIFKDWLKSHLDDDVSDNEAPWNFEQARHTH